MKFLKKGTYGKTRYLDTPIYIDTETSWNHDPEDPKTWIVSIQVSFNGKQLFLRRPSELMEWLNDQIRTYDLNNERRCLVVIHNHSFDLSYLLPYIQLYLPYKEDHSCILQDEHKIINYRQGGLDFRCSYMLTQKSLEKLGKDLNVEHKKKVGMYDYNRIHYQDDAISQQEQDYAIYDVISLAECYEKQMQLHGDTAASIPLTATGYIRRKLRASCKKDRYYRNKYFTKTKLTAETYPMQRGSYAGGYAHNNRYFREKVIRPEEYGMQYIKHRDFRSHYPTQMRKNLQPLGKPQIYYDCGSAASRYLNPNISIEEILALSPRFSTVTALCIHACQLKDPKFPFPILQESKLEFESFEDHANMRIWADNGRVLKIQPKSDDVFCMVYVQERTLRLLYDQYDIDGVIAKVMRIPNKPLPACISDVIDELFKAKTDLKYKVKECEERYGSFADETFNAKAELMITKSLLNAIYGCCCFDPVRYNFDIDYERENPIFISNSIKTVEDIQKILDEYYKSRNNFLPYQLGCSITDQAKFELFEYMEVIGPENVLYCDTDSLFYLSNDEIEKKVEALNEKKRKTAPYVTDSKGNKIYYDVFEEEPDVIAFKGLHSKCYGVVIDQNGRPELQVTIAGVPARTIIGMDGETPIYKTREEELSEGTKDPFEALDNLSEDMIFRINTGTTCDYSTMGKPHIEMINGHRIETAGGAIIQKLDAKQVKNMDLDEDIDFTPMKGELL